MSIPRTTGWGSRLAAATAGISGVSIFVNGLVVKEFSRSGRPDRRPQPARRARLLGVLDRQRRRR